MSNTIKIQTRSNIDIEKLYDFLWQSDRSVVGVGRSQDVVYFYSKGYSTRGIDIYRGNTGYEVRLMILANPADYKLANSVALFFRINTPDAVIRLDDNMVETANVFLTNELTGYFKRDVGLIYQLANQHQTAITLFAADQEYYLGEYAFSKIDMEKPGWEMRAEQLIQQVLYKLPKSESDHVMQIGEGKDTKTAKLVTADVLYVLKKYDALLFNKSKNSNQMDDLCF